ncbi:MAG: undecaprenyl-diphosphate phosphatase [bacterium]
MSILKALIMGLVQGLAEFLPISSKSHLVFADHFLHIHLTASDTVFFDVMLHWGTLLAVVIYFYKDILMLLGGLGALIVRPKQAWAENVYSRLAVFLILGTIPAGLLYFKVKSFLEARFENFPATAIMLLITAAFLFWISRRKEGERKISELTWKDALLVGFFQACALFPGISRSGSTITGGLLCGMDRETAPRFSFLLSIPVILAAGVVKSGALLHGGGTISTPALVAGFLASAVSGFFAVSWLMKIMQGSPKQLAWFSLYCVIVGLAMTTYWYKMVPQLDIAKTVATVNNNVTGKMDGEDLAGLSINQKVLFTVTVKPGIPVKSVSILAPRMKGKKLELKAFELEKISDGVFAMHEKKIIGKEVDSKYDPYAIEPLTGHEYQKTQDREVFIILKGDHGVENTIPLTLKLVPEASKVGMLPATM